MLQTNQNNLLTETGPGTPMGKLMRQYWIPVTLTERLEAGGAPVPITILGEDLVAYRSPNGELGLMGAVCPHRGASMALARNEDCGLRCLYHAWLIDRTGKILETPPEPPEVSIGNHVKHVAYPTHETAGVMWAYMGDLAKMPEFPHWVFANLPAANVYATHALQECNYLQALEGDLDAQHAPYLHYTKAEAEVQLRAKKKENEYVFDRRPKTAAKRFPWGVQTVFRYVHKDEQAATFWIHPFIMPFFTMFESNLNDTDGGLLHAWVPCTDKSHYVWSILFSQAAFSDEYRQFIDQTRGYGQVDKQNNYRPLAWTGSGFKQDRAAMARGDSFSGIDGILQQDLAVQHSMGPIVDRSKEHLTSGDVAIVNLRRYLLDAVAASQSDVGHATIPAETYESFLFEAFTDAVETPMSEMLARSRVAS